MNILDHLGQTIITVIISLTTLLTGNASSSLPYYPPNSSSTSRVEQPVIPPTKKASQTNTFASTTKSTNLSKKQLQTPKKASFAQNKNAGSSSIPQQQVSQPEATTNRKIRLATTTIAQKEPIEYEELPKESNAILDRIQKSTVNIYCTARDGSTEKVLTGSGVLIDPRGIVLTNAHVAQYPLLEKDFSHMNLKCVGRTGSPAAASYDMEILYISPRWVEVNFKNLGEEYPKESGEFDFALLKFVRPEPHAQPFPYLPLISRSETPTINQKIILSAYPALIVQKNGIGTLLRSNLDTNTVRDYFSFTGKYIDLIQTNVSSLAEPGASGGPITDEHGNLIAIIATTLPASSNSKYIQAITIRHINDTLSAYKWTTLDELLQLNTVTLKEDFNLSQRERLRSLLLTGLKLSQQK